MRGAAALLVLAACGDNLAVPAPPDAAPPVCDGGHHVCRGQIRDPDGRAMILRGINVSGSQKSAPYLGWVAEPDLARLHDDWGFDAIRWVMPWAAIEPTQGHYDDAYLDAVRTRLDWAAAHGLTVVLDMHQDVYGEGFGFDGAPAWTCDAARYAAFVPKPSWSLDYLDPNVEACFDGLWTDDALGAAFAAAWRHVAEKLGDHPAVLGFDIINEPHWGTYSIFDFEHDRLEPFEKRVIAAVRAVAPTWLAFVEPSSSRNVGFATGLVPFDEPDVVYAPHAYDAGAEQTGLYDPAHRDAFVSNIARLRGEADALGAALWIGEYGGVGSDPQVAAYLDAAYDGAGAVAASSIDWDYDHGGYGPIDASGAEVAGEIAGQVRPYPTRIAGDPIDWTLDDAGVLTVRWTPRAEITAPTLIEVPARLGAVDVACGGCAVSVDGDVVSLGAVAPDGAGVATATLTPR